MCKPFPFITDLCKPFPFLSTLISESRKFSTCHSNYIQNIFSPVNLLPPQRTLTHGIVFIQTVSSSLALHSHVLQQLGFWEGQESEVYRDVHVLPLCTLSTPRFFDGGPSCTLFLSSCRLALSDGDNRSTCVSSLKLLII